MQPTKKDEIGTSFFGTVFNATPQQLFDLLPSEPVFNENNGQDKVNFEWVLETNSGNLFTIYDYKEYRKLDLDEVIEWYIGGFDPEYTIEALNEINALLSAPKTPKQTDKRTLQVVNKLLSSINEAYDEEPELLKELGIDDELIERLHHFLNTGFSSHLG